ncbi:kaempferol 3-O-beta-D-galactosyltransferase-like [Cucumis melo var. makuwa]|uniref:Kaempferol 3-O-beta-D-galactosyltransferase-like n=1 Tax=Cucumis melo var. makuwa TaxID=1194695 RepID=A0A5D3CI30_CUCMM|nr:kaempferol 3-O-beta-D-galactosyltransferase-like [Cucumis melo var. makuwa]
MSMEEVARSHDWKHQVLVLAFPFGSHPCSLLGLVRRLASDAPDVKFSFFNTATSNAAIFNDGRRNDNVFPYSVSDGLPEGYVRRWGVPEEPVELFLKAACGNFREAITAEVAGVEVGGVVSDAFLWFAGEIAAEMEVAWVPVWIAGLRSLVVHLHTDLFRQNLADSGDDEEKVINFLPGFSNIRNIDLPHEGIHADLESPITTMLYKMELHLPKASVVVVNSFKETEPVMFDLLKPKLRELLTIAPINLTSPTKSIINDEYGCLEWLDKEKPNSIAYICFGTFVALPPHELEALAEALVESGVRFLWSFRGNPEESFSEDVLQTFDLQGKLVPWAPQTRVLAHPSVGIYISHCGWNSVLEAIMEGVPMICRPFVGDNGLNVRTIGCEWKVGLGLPNGIFTKDGVIKAMETILDPYKGDQIRSNLKALKHLALKANEPEGSSTKNFNSLKKLLTK